MTDTQEPVVEQSETAQPETATPTPEQESAIRNHIYNNLLGEYKRFASIILNSSIAETSLGEGFRFLDTGMLWIKEACYHGPLVNKRPVAEPAESSEPKECNSDVESSKEEVQEA